MATYYRFSTPGSIISQNPSDTTPGLYMPQSGSFLQLWLIVAYSMYGLVFLLITLIMCC